MKPGRWADRLSANIELARDADLVQLAPAKSHREIETSMQQIVDGILDAKDKVSRAGSSPHFAPAGQSTQFVVGATDAPDAAILHKASDLYRRFKLRRAYYSAFSPIPFSNPLLPVAKIPLVREHRLYQADWLMRFYGFSAEELTTPTDRNLALDKDPKLGWALRHREFFPVDVNKAAREALLRVPGFGVRNVKRILKIRKFRALRLADLEKLRIPTKRARYFVITSDHNPDANVIDGPALADRFQREPEQMSLFSALTGEL